MPRHDLLTTRKLPRRFVLTLHQPMGFTALGIWERGPNRVQIRPRPPGVYLVEIGPHPQGQGMAPWAVLAGLKEGMSGGGLQSYLQRWPEVGTLRRLTLRERWRLLFGPDPFPPVPVEPTTPVGPPRFALPLPESGALRSSWQERLGDLPKWEGQLGEVTETDGEHPIFRPAFMAGSEYIQRGKPEEPCTVCGKPLSGHSPHYSIRACVTDCMGDLWAL